MSIGRMARGFVATVPASCVLAEAARQMTMFGVGALVIAESRAAEPLGIVTDRDLVKLIGEGVDPAVGTVACFVGGGLETAPIGSTTQELLAKMRHAGVRRLPIVDSEGRLAQMVSLDDLLILLGRELGDVAQAIEAEFDREQPVPSAHDRSL